MVEHAQVTPEAPSEQARRFVQYRNGSTASSYVAMVHVNPGAFDCYGCVRTYGDPPLIRIRYTHAELKFCTTNCALEEGFAEAVEAHFEAELAGEAQDFVWEDHRYERVEVYA